MHYGIMISAESDISQFGHRGRDTVAYLSSALAFYQSESLNLICMSFTLQGYRISVDDT